MSLSHKKLLMFDFDGTLIDSVPDLAESVNHTMAQLNRPTYSVDTIRGWVGNGAVALVKRALVGHAEIATESQGFDSAQLDKALEIFLTHYADNLCIHTHMYDGVKQGLERLKAAGYILTIITNKPERFVSPILVGLDLVGLFEFTLGADSLPLKKPDPLPLLHTCQNFNIEPAQAVMIGDSKNDILAAKNANITSIAVSYGYNYGESVEMYQPDLTADRFEEVVSALID